MQQAVVEALVVAVVEAELLELALQVPVRLGRRTGSRGGRPAPRRSLRSSTPDRVCGPAALAPRPREDVVEQQHGHVAAHPVGLVPDVDQRVRRSLAQSRGERVELGDVRPRAGSTGRDRGRSRRRRLPRKPTGSPARSSAVPWMKYSGWSREPRVVGSDVVGDEVDHQTHAAFGQSGPRRGQPGRPPKRAVDLVAADAVRRSEDIGLDEVRRARRGTRPSGQMRRGRVVRRPGCVARLPSATRRRPRAGSRGPTRVPGTSASVDAVPARAPTSWSQAAVFSS